VSLKIAPNISRGNAATRLRCGGIFTDVITALLLRPNAKEFRKSISIRESYGHLYDSPPPCSDPVLTSPIIMAALCNRCGHYIFAL